MIQPSLLVEEAVDHGRWATSDAVTSIGIKLPQHSKSLSNYGLSLPIDARILGILGNFLIPSSVFAFQAFEALGTFEPGSTLATSDAKTSRGIDFLQDS